MKWVLNFERCKGCALCTGACPKKILVIQEERINANGYYTARCVDADACVGCALCAVMCPDCAIEITD
ncbi:MAG: 4Fe-4S binding protein [Oscillospiraceae bacterium]|jgi:2-oxoglutarate ferredoxin oxidoreductase subunit delta|nr:4Fe-4S binding protein [Oscillospiraceae bacterium]